MRGNKTDDRLNDSMGRSGVSGAHNPRPWRASAQQWWRDVDGPRPRGTERGEMAGGSPEPCAPALTGDASLPRRGSPEARRAATR